MHAFHGMQPQRDQQFYCTQSPYQSEKVAIVATQYLEFEQEAQIKDTLVAQFFFWFHLALLNQQQVTDPGGAKIS